MCYLLHVTEGSNPEPPPAQVTCPGGYTPYWYECFRLYQDPREWPQGNEECESQMSTLPSIHGHAENAALQIMVLRTGIPIWIGLKNWEVSINYLLLIF